MFTIPFPLELEKGPSDQDTLLSLEPAFFGDLKENLGGGAATRIGRLGRTKHDKIVEEKIKE